MIDITFDFRSDAKGKDPDTHSPMLNMYHRVLWSKKTPNGEVMDLHSNKAPFVLYWKDYCFTSNTIIVREYCIKNNLYSPQERTYDRIECKAGLCTGR